MGESKVSHCFPLNGKESNPEVNGTSGILKLYKENLKNINLSGPTYFQYVLKKMIEQCKAKQHLPTYNILLIITDGEIHDMNETKALIVDGSEFPLSVIIVGVGNEEFKLMKQLDADKHMITDAKGRSAKRDIV